MTEKNFPLANDSFLSDDIQAAIDVLKSGRYTMGVKVRQFEEEIAQWTGAKHAIMVNSGSTANLLLVYAMICRLRDQDILLSPGDEVLVPSLSWPTTVWPLSQLGLTPVFVDIDPNSLAISLEQAEKALSPKTKGMFLIHVLGQACDMNAYTDFCEAHGITLIEDCCESFGSFYNGKHVGNFGLGGTLSHFFSHQLTTMEGGTILVNDSELAEDLKTFRAHGWSRERKDRDELGKLYPDIDDSYLFVLPGFNVRPTEIQGALGSSQLKKAKDFLQKRENLAYDLYQVVEKDIPWMKIIGGEFLHQLDKTDYTSRRHSWMNIPIILSDDSPLDINAVKSRLNQAGVETRPIIAGNMLKHPACQKIQYRQGENFDVSDKVLKQSFMIGCHPTTSDSQRDHLLETFRNLAL